MLWTAIEWFGKLTGLSQAAIVLGAAGIIVTGAVTAYGAWHHQVYQSGYDRAIRDIARADAAAVGRASELRNSWRACRDADRNWDQTTGRCQ